MRRFLLVGLTALVLIGCGPTHLLPPLSPAGSGQLVVHVHVNSPAAALRTTDAATVRLLKDDGAQKMRFIVRMGTEEIRKQDFDVSAGQGEMSNVPAGTFTLISQALDAENNPIYTDTTPVTIEPNKRNTATAALDAIPVVNGSLFQPGDILMLTGRRFASSVTALIDDQEVPTNRLSSTVIEVFLSGTKADLHKIIVRNKRDKKDTESNLRTFRSGLTIKQGTLDLDAGATVSVIPLVDPSLSNDIDWSSSDTNLALVSDQGVVTARAPGNVTITAILKSTRQVESIKLTIRPRTSAGPSVPGGTPASTTGSVSLVTIIAPSSIVSPSETLPLSAIVTLSNSVRRRNVTWSSSDASIATVDPSGLVTGIGLGKVTITAKSQDDLSKSDSIPIEVIAQPPVSQSLSVQSIRVDQPDTNLEIGAVVPYSATVLLSNGSAENKVTWRSSDSSRVLVDAAGVVEAKAPGSAVITATSTRNSSQSASTMVTVVPPPTPTPAPTTFSTPAPIGGSPPPGPAGGVFVVTTLAGSSVGGFGDGTGAEALFLYPAGVAVDSSGNVYVADNQNHRIRKITPAGVVTTLAGSGVGGPGNGSGTGAQFFNPGGVAVDSSGNVYVADALNVLIRKITPTGLVTTLAGSGDYSFADGTGTAAAFNVPRGVAVDSGGNVYVADQENHRIRKIDSSGVVTTLAGGTPGAADGTGTAAQFQFPAAVAVDSSGNIYVADLNNHSIRRLTPAGVVTTLAGNGTCGSAIDGTGTAAQFCGPKGVAVDSSGNIFVADSGNNLIRQVTPAGVVTTAAGSTNGFADGTGTAAQFSNPIGVAVDTNGNVYVGDESNHRIRKIRRQ